MKDIKDILPENKDCPYLDKCNHIDCNTFCLKRYKTNYYFDNANISKEKRIRFPLRIDSDGSDEKAFTRLAIIDKDIIDFVDKGKSLYIYSRNVGNGKTSWALR